MTTKQPVIISNAPNNSMVREVCTLCDRDFRAAPYLFGLPDGSIVCENCAENPPDGYITKVVPCPEDRAQAQLGMYADFPDWMRQRLKTNGEKILFDHYLYGDGPMLARAMLTLLEEHEPHPDDAQSAWILALHVWHSKQTEASMHDLEEEETPF